MSASDCSPRQGKPSEKTNKLALGGERVFPRKDPGTVGEEGIWFVFRASAGWEKVSAVL